MENDTVFADGVYFNKKHENAPDFVKGGVGIEVDKFVAFLQKHRGEDGRVSLDLLQKKDKSGLYFKLNTYKPEKKQTVGDTSVQYPEGWESPDF